MYYYVHHLSGHIPLQAHSLPFQMQDLKFENYLTKTKIGLSSSWYLSNTWKKIKIWLSQFAREFRHLFFASIGNLVTDH